jgi:hypothetical protein
MMIEFTNLEKLDLSRSRQDRLIPSVKCADGFWVSIQGHEGAYSDPRETLRNIYEYDEMEIKVSELLPERFNQYRDGDSSIYGYVPVEMIEALLVEHGGIADTKLDDTFDFDSLIAQVIELESNV